MASARDTIKQLMLGYPTLYPSPFKAAEELMIGSNWTWEEGELMPRSPVKKSKDTMDFSDLDAQALRIDADAKEWQANPSVWNHMQTLHQERLLDHQFERIQRQFVSDHLETFLDASLDHEFRREGKPVFASQQMLSLNPTYAAAFNFPDDLEPDWAKLVHHFMQSWHYLLAVRYGPTQGEGHIQDVSHWPEHAQTIHEALRAAQVRLHPIMNAGESYEDGMARRQALSKRLISEVVSEEKAESALGDARKRTTRPGR